MNLRPKETVQEIYDRYWKGLVEIDGAMDEDLVKAELADFEFLLDQVPLVYDDLTGGRISKPNTYAFEVIREAHNVFEKQEKDIALDDIEEMAKDSKTVEELMEQIRDYLNTEDLD